MIDLKGYSVSFLRILAAEVEGSELRTLAVAELQRRGKPMVAPDSPDGKRVAAMTTSTRATSKPCVRHDGRSVIFGARPAEKETPQTSQERAAMRAAMGLPAEGSGVRTERGGHVQIFGVQTAEQARAAVRRGAGK